MNRSLPQIPGKLVPGTGTARVSEETLPDSHLVQRGQLGKVRMHQADSLEEAAVLVRSHLWQVCFQKRTEVMSSRLLTSPPHPKSALSAVTEHGSQP